jgi:hypothetical protein
VDLAQSAGVQPVEALLAGLMNVDESDLSEDAEMFRSGWLLQPETVGDMPHRELAILEQREDRPALRLGDGIEHIGGCRGARM